MSTVQRGIHSVLLRQLPDSEPNAPELMMSDIPLSPYLDRGRRAVRIGRHAANDVVLDSARIPRLLNRFHCYIEMTFEADGNCVYTMGDKGSVNGTYEGTRMLRKGERRTLTHGTVVSFGGPQNVIINDTTHRNPFRFLLSAASS